MENLEKSYSLATSVSVEYERDEKIVPSGFAKISFTLEPHLESLASRVILETNIEESWHLLEFHNHRNELLETSPEIEKACQKEW